MRLSASLIVLSLVYGASCVPEPLRGESRFSSSRNVSLSSDSEYMTSLASRHLSNWDLDSNHTASAAAAAHLKAQSNPHSWRRRLSSATRYQHWRSTNLKTLAYARVRAAEYTVDTGTRTSAETGLGTHLDLKNKTKVKVDRRSPQGTQVPNLAPTPAPTASASPLTTVHITDETDFSLLLPKNPNELISDAEPDAVAFCTSAGCANSLPVGFITAAAVTSAPDNTSWIQVTGCLDPTKIPLSPSDDGGQFDVRFPNGAQCSFGGYGASFIEQVEPSAKRFCLRCCSSENDQTNCNSHQDRAGCPTAIPGAYDFPDKGVSCA